MPGPEPADPSRWRLLALPPLPVEMLESLLADLPVAVSVPDTRDRGGLHAALPGAEIVVGDWTGTFRLADAEAEIAGQLAFVQQPSVGVETIDLAAFGRRGVPVSNVAGTNSIAVAEWCIAATLAVLRCLGWADSQVRAGSWPNLDVAGRGSMELAGRRVGILGFGPIGRACAERFAAFGCPVAYWSRSRRGPAESAGAVYLEFAELLATSDVLVVVVAFGPETAGVLDARRLALLPSGAILVNAARGGIVDEPALAAAVERGSLAGAAVDVYDTEPLPESSPLRGNERILLSPHAAGSTQQSLARIVSVLHDNIERAVLGEPVHFLCNDAAPLVRRRS
ncbi:MAG TPA: NAD(P)-dependent oxidoreductase [Mycobacteriales bacterium]|nr:NAD(P)-dependent oxidoreductase [Mycobacteriales bacterium]